MSDEKHGTANATRQDLAAGARRHYDQLATAACNYYSAIDHAIDSWEREPELLAQLAASETALAEARLETITAREQAQEALGKLQAMTAALVAFLNDPDLEPSVVVNDSWSDGRSIECYICGAKKVVAHEAAMPSPSELKHEDDCSYAAAIEAARGDG